MRSVRVSFLAIDNPVMWAELKHQRHIIQSSRSGWFWIVLALVMLVPGFLTAVFMLVAAFSGLDLEPLMDNAVVNVLGNIGVISLTIMHFALYIVVTLVTVALAARSIVREQEGHTWESLLLTDLSARQIVQGKWWATLRALWGDHVMVLFMRLGFVAWLHIAVRSIGLNSPVSLLAGILFVIVLSALDSALSVILGILPAVSGGHPAITLLAGGLRIGLALVMLIVPFAVGMRVVDWPFDMVVGGLVILMIFALAVAGMLRLTEWAAVRNLVSPARAVPA